MRNRLKILGFESVSERLCLCVRIKNGRKESNPGMSQKMFATELSH